MAVKREHEDLLAAFPEVRHVRDRCRHLRVGPPATLGKGAVELFQVPAGVREVFGLTDGDPFEVERVADVPSLSARVPERFVRRA